MEDLVSGARRADGAGECDKDGFTMFCLASDTDEDWARLAVSALDDILVDHAHCELKAAANALSLAAHPQASRMARRLSELAREEMEHFERVMGELEARELSLGAPLVNPYVEGLRRACRELPRSSELCPLVDRFLVGALIEARSCERFKRLAKALETSPEHRSVQALYQELFEAEAGHYRLYANFAEEVRGRASELTVRARLAQLASREAELVAASGHATHRRTIHG